MPEHSDSVFNQKPQERDKSKEQTESGEKPSRLRNISLTPDARAATMYTDSVQGAIARLKTKYPVFGFGKPPTIRDLIEEQRKTIQKVTWRTA